MLKTQKLVHFTIPVKDLDRSEKFYTDILGFQKVRRNPHMVFMRSGQDHFVLTHSEKPIDPNPGDNHEIHTAFLVDPAEYDRAMLAAHGSPPGADVSATSTTTERTAA